MLTTLQILCVSFAFILFLMGASTRWWPTNPSPYYPTFMSAGLAFLTLGLWLVPLMTK